MGTENKPQIAQIFLTKSWVRIVATPKRESNRKRPSFSTSSNL
jgi:hypothetical protein